MNSEELASLLSMKEGTTLDFKVTLNEESFPDLPKDIAAFANADGGTIIVGVDDSNNQIGTKWTQKQTEAVMLSGRKCKPSIEVKVTTHLRRSKKFIAIEIPRGVVIHSDNLDRFPIRFGDRTDFMDFRTFLLTANSKGLTQGQPQGISPPYSSPLANLPFARKKVTRTETFLFNRLDSSEPRIRIAALADLFNFSFRASVERMPNFYEKVTHLLSDGDQDVRLATLNLIDRIESISKNHRFRAQKSLVTAIEKLVSDPDSSIRGRALYLMATIGRAVSTDIYVDTVINESSQTFPQVANLNNTPRAFAEHKKGRRLLIKLYKELAKPHDTETTKRLNELFASLRTFYWSSE